MGERRGALRVLVGRPEGQRNRLERLHLYGRMILKSILKKWQGRHGLD